MDRKQVTEKLATAFNRADELGGELRDYIQDKLATDERYIKARRAWAKLRGKSFESKAEVVAKARAAYEALLEAHDGIQRLLEEDVAPLAMLQIALKFADGKALSDDDRWFLNDRGFTRLARLSASG